MADLELLRRWQRGYQEALDRIAAESKRAAGSIREFTQHLNSGEDDTQDGS